MFVWPAQRINPMTVLRRAAMTCGMWPHRTWERSSSKVHSGLNGSGLEHAERAERGEDISAHFTQNYGAKQQVNIDSPLALLREIDAEC